MDLNTFSKLDSTIFALNAGICQSYSVRDNCKNGQLR